MYHKHGGVAVDWDAAHRTQGQGPYNVLVSVEDFDYDAIDEKLADDDPMHKESEELRRFKVASEESTRAGEWTSAFLDLLLCKAINRSALAGIGMRVLSLAWLTRHHHKGLNGKSLEHISKKVGCSRALLSHYVRGFEDSLGGRLHAGGQKAQTLHDTFRDSAKEGWNKRRDKQIQVRIWFRARAKGMGKELAGALENQPAAVIEEILTSWADHVVEELAAKKDPNDSKRPAWPRP